MAQSAGQYYVGGAISVDVAGTAEDVRILVSDCDIRDNIVSASVGSSGGAGVAVMLHGTATNVTMALLKSILRNNSAVVELASGDAKVQTSEVFAAGGGLWPQCLGSATNTTVNVTGSLASNTALAKAAGDMQEEVHAHGGAL